MTALKRRVEALEKRSPHSSDMAARLERLTTAELERLETIMMALGPVTEEAMAAMPPHDLQFLFDVGLLTEVPDGYA